MKNMIQSEIIQLLDANSLESAQTKMGLVIQVLSQLPPNHIIETRLHSQHYVDNVISYFDGRTVIEALIVLRDTLRDFDAMPIFSLNVGKLIFMYSAILMLTSWVSVLVLHTNPLLDWISIILMLIAFYIIDPRLMLNLSKTNKRKGIN